MQDDFFAILTDRNISTRMCRIVDISSGGMGLYYKDWDDQPVEEAAELIVMSDNDNSNDHIRFRFKISRVYEFEIPDEN